MEGQGGWSRDSKPMFFSKGSLPLFLADEHGKQHILWCSDIVALVPLGNLNA